LDALFTAANQQLISVDTRSAPRISMITGASQPHLVTEREILGLANLKPVACLQ